MLNNFVYLDHNAASLMLEEIRDKIGSMPKIPLNPSSVHQAGRLAKSYIEKARSSILSSVNADSNIYNLVFTSSGTESNNTIIKSFQDKILITSKTEHLSVLSPIMQNENHILLDVDAFGYVSMNQLENILRDHPGKCFVSIQLANNETGIIQDIKAISAICHKYDAIIHSDAIQAYGKTLLDITDLNLDIVTISSNKVGGPKATSAIIYKKNIEIARMMIGGGQEKGKRAGSENLEGIIGFGEFASQIENSIIKFEHIKALRDMIEREISAISHNSIVGHKSNRLPNTSCILMPYKNSALQQIAFDLKNIAISSGAACSSGKITKSHVLEAMKIDEAHINCAIRVSLGHNNTLDEAKLFVKTWKEIYKQGNQRGEQK
jgi:cysteine desulfurase